LAEDGCRRERFMESDSFPRRQIQKRLREVRGALHLPAAGDTRRIEIGEEKTTARRAEKGYRAGA
jgi:hypothetical protein